MYNPYENDPIKNRDDLEQKNSLEAPTVPGYGTESAPYTAQTAPAAPASPAAPADRQGTETQSAGEPHNPHVSGTPGGYYRPASFTTQAPAPGQSSSGENRGVPVGNPYTPGTRSTTGSAGYPGTSSPVPSRPVQATPGTGPVHPVQPVQPARPAYTWNPRDPRETGAYYSPAPAPVPKKKRKGKAGKIALRVLAGALACAVISFGSVGAFALLIQNGVVNVQSTGSEQTAAITLYKQAETDASSSTPTVTVDGLTAQEVAKKVIPSVVCIQNYQITQQGGYFFGGYEDGGNGSEVSPAGEGSGIIISKDGYIVTNQHVVADATSLKVVTSEGLSYEAELVGEDTQTDLAVIKITTEDELTPAEFGSSKDLEVADEVMAIGNPGGLQLNSSVTFGRISALNRQVTNSDTGYTVTCIQTDAAINPGNSGGALVDMNGHIVGINSSKIVATEYEGLGFAIPSDSVQPVVSDLIEHGYVKDRPMLGIGGQYIDRMTASFFGLTSGYYVSRVSSDNAQQAGLQKGDVIIAIDDTQVTSASTISSYIAGKKPGDTVTLTVVRASSSQESLQLDVVLSENTGESN